jgi:hypothetical protein
LTERVTHLPQTRTEFDGWLDQIDEDAGGHIELLTHETVSGVVETNRFPALVKQWSGVPARGAKIEVGFDSCGSEEALTEYVAWLNARGYVARAGNTTASYIDGVRVGSVQDYESAALEKMNALWDEFCNA